MEIIRRVFRIRKRPEVSSHPHELEETALGYFADPTNPEEREQAISLFHYLRSGRHMDPVGPVYARAFAQQGIERGHLSKHEAYGIMLGACMDYAQYLSLTYRSQPNKIDKKDLDKAWELAEGFRILYEDPNNEAK